MGNVIFEVVIATLIILSVLSLLEIPWLSKKERRVTAFFRLSVLTLAGFLWLLYNEDVASNLVNGVGENIVRITRFFSTIVQRIGNMFLLGGV